jgi:hypothetical protein
VPSSHQQRYARKYQEHDEKHFRNAGSAGGDAAESEGRGNDRDHEKDGSPVQHGRAIPFFFCSLLGSFVACDVLVAIREVALDVGLGSCAGRMPLGGTARRVQAPPHMAMDQEENMGGAGAGVTGTTDGDEVLLGAVGEPTPATLRTRLVEAVRSRPLLAVLAASGVGATLGGLVFSRLGRFVFLAAAGYAVSELWRREGTIDTREILTRLTRVGTVDDKAM